MTEMAYLLLQKSLAQSLMGRKLCDSAKATCFHESLFLFFSSLSFFGILAKAWSSSSGHSDLLFLYEVIPAPFCIVAVTNIQASSLPLLHLPLLGSCQDLQLTKLQGFFFFFFFKKKTKKKSLLSF